METTYSMFYFMPQNSKEPSRLRDGSYYMYMGFFSKRVLCSIRFPLRYAE